MSYDINFWKLKTGVTLDSQATYERLNHRETVDGLELLPVDAIVAKLREAFPSYDPTEDFPTAELSEGSMEIFAGPQSFRFDFRGGDTGAEKAKIWEILSGFDCVCYDPQDGTLHTRDNPPDFGPMSPEMRKLRDDVMNAIMSGKDLKDSIANANKVVGVEQKRGCGTAVLLVALGAVCFGGAVVAIIH